MLRQSSTHTCGRQRISPIVWAGLLAGSAFQAQAQAAAASSLSDSAVSGGSGWQACQTMNNDPNAQLACFKQWASAQGTADAAVGIVHTSFLAALNPNPADNKPAGCRNKKYSGLSRFWELQRGADCDNFSLRGHRPLSLAVSTSDKVNTQPTSPVPGYSALTAQPYKRTENKIQLSVRTKIAKGLIKNGITDDADQDSLWFGYTQQSYWQLYNTQMYGAFRTTDHEPELIYIYPHQIPLAAGWNYRLSGLGLVHQSNGQSQPLHRDWDRAYLMGAAEKTLGPNSSLTLQGRVWQRVRASSSFDTNPGIENYIGRAELAGNWQINKFNTVGVTVRHSLRKEAKGSTRIDWMMAPASSPSYHSLRYHVQLFSGYGDSLLDYNKRRNVLSVGLSLVDW